MQAPALVLSSVKKYVFFLIVFVVSCFLSPVAALAQTSPSYSSSTTFAAGATQDQHTRVQTLLYDSLSAVNCMLTGIDPINPKGCLAFDAGTNQFSYVTTSPDQAKVGGAIGALIGMSSSLYDIPIHTSDYTKNIADNFGIAPKAYAQNTGFDQLIGILPVWVIFRNLAYLIFILIFILIGLGVMLRIKIDPRTVMSIQNQIPRLIVGLILITFSYAIAGFMVDLMWTTTYMVINLSGNVKDNQPTPQVIVNVKDTTNNLLLSPLGFSNIFFDQGLRGLSAGTAGAVGNSAAELFSPFYSHVDVNCQFWTSGIEACIRSGVRSIISTLVGAIAFLIVAFALLIALFKIWWQLLKSFAYVVIYTTIAPLYIAAGLIPGSQTNFSGWFRGLASNLIIYPATVAFFLAAKIFLTLFNSTPYRPPLTGNPSVDGGFGYIVAFAIIMVAPELINMIRDALKSPASKYIAPAIQRGLQSGAAPITGGASMYWRTITRPYDHISHRPAGWLRSTVVGTTMRHNRFQNFMYSVFGGR